MTGRNEPCPCGSRKKYKKCHGPGAPPDASAAAGAGQPEKVEVPVHYGTPQNDLFFRGAPATMEGPPGRWEAARTVIDFGNWVLTFPAPLPPDRALRDAVLTALLRRALVTAEGIRVLLTRGLAEPAIGLMRTLLDIELAMRLVTQDATNRMAERLAAWHYLSSQKHGQRMLGNRETRETLERGEGGRQRMVEITRSYAAFLDSPSFDDVRKEVRDSLHWHGYKNAQEAFAAAGAVTDYYILYDIGSFFVHVTNVDHDFAEVREHPGGREFALKPLVERDPQMLRAPLGNMALRLHGILAMYIEDRGLGPAIEAAVEELEKAHPAAPVPDSVHLGPLTGVMTTLLQHFGDLGPKNDFEPAGGPD